MKDDPRRILEDAAERRLPCELLPRGGSWVRATVVRVERGGIVVTAPGAGLVGGEDVAVWLAVDGVHHRFEASVLRAGVPVPDRSHDGLMLGFVDRWMVGTGVRRPSEGRELALLPHNGPPVSLLEPPAAIVELGVDGVAFTLPSDFKMIFVESGLVRFRMAVPEHPPLEGRARVRTLAPGEGYLLYGLSFEDVDDPEMHRELVMLLSEF